MATPSIVLVTGGNGGVGYETVKALLQSSKPHTVLLGSRSLERGKAAAETLLKEVPETKSTIDVLQVDLASDESIEKAFEEVKTKYGYLDVLLNNGGVTLDMDFIAGKIGLRDCFNQSYDVNVAGTQVITWTFIPLLLKSKEPRLIFVTGLSQITKAAEKYFPTPPQPAGWPKKIAFETIGYRSSKCALNMIMLDWNHKLKEDGIKVFGVTPGMVATNLGGIGPEKAREMGAGDPSVSGQFFTKVIEGERDADVGKLISKDGFVDW